MDKPTLPKGTRDFGPAQMAKRQFILNVIQSVFRKYGFQPLETPAMENLSTLTGKYGDEGDQLLFKILNSGDYLKDVEQSKLETRNSKLVTQTKNPSPKLKTGSSRFAVPRTGIAGTAMNFTWIWSSTWAKLSLKRFSNSRDHLSNCDAFAIHT